MACLNFKSLLCFLPYFAERFFRKFCRCFDNAFAQLEVIAITRNRSVEIVAVAESGP